ncbi:MAG: ABC transporter permease [Gemmatimonadota bacterium]|nr:MAG: ABC transporter permease [Gemmatimonadota bacterium]
MRDWKRYVREHLPLPDIEGSLEVEVVEEIAIQLEDGYRAARARGAGEEEAEAEALALIGDWSTLARDVQGSKRFARAPRIEHRVEDREFAIRTRGGSWVPVADMLRDLRLAVRRLRRAPAFGAVVVLTLGMGIGANTAIFSLVKGILLDPLPYEEPERLVAVLNTAPGVGEEVLPQSAAVHFTYEDESRLLEAVGLYNRFDVTVLGLDEPVRIPSIYVTAGTLPTLRARPLLGRLFSAEDATPGTPFTVILSYGYWQNQFGGDPEILGRTMSIGGEAREIIGVLPRGFRFLEHDPAVYLPFRFDRSSLTVSNFTNPSVARLREGATLEAATADLARLMPVAVEKFPGGVTLAFLEEARGAPLLLPLKETIVGDVGDVLWVLLGTVGIVLLIACANVANLFLVRAEARERELAVRRAMGAKRRQVAGQFLVESVLLGLLGGVVGLGLAHAGLRLLVAIAPANLPRLDEVSLDPVVLIFTLCISIISGVLFGLFPVLRWGHADLVNALKEGGRGSGAGRERHRTRNALVVGQITLALVLLIGSSLMVRSFQAIRRANPGFRNPAEIMILGVSVTSEVAESPDAIVQTHEAIAHRLAEVPGVTSVGSSSSVTMDGRAGWDPIFVEDSPLPEGQLPPTRRFKWIGAGYFETMGNPIVAGRTLGWTDIYNRARVVLVTENFAREYWSDPAEAIGERIGTGMAPGNWREIIGVVGDVRDDGVTQDPVAIVYWPMLLEDFWPEIRGDEPFVALTQFYAIRSPRVGTAGFLREVKEAVWSFLPNRPLTNVQNLEDMLRGSMARTSFTLVMLGIAAAVALLLATVGVYGVISYVVSQRTREIGVRIALGAGSSTVTGMVVRQGLFLAVIGVALGLAAAYGLSRLMTSLLFGVSALDPLTYAMVAVCLTAIALLASYLPARRAARVDPMEALRAE